MGSIKLFVIGSAVLLLAVAGVLMTSVQTAGAACGGYGGGCPVGPAPALLPSTSGVSAAPGIPAAVGGGVPSAVLPAGVAIATPALAPSQAPLDGPQGSADGPWAATESRGALPFTGINLLRAVALGVGALVAAGVIMLLARDPKRRSLPPPAA